MNIVTNADTQLFYWLFARTQNRSMSWVKQISKTGDGPIYTFAAIILFFFAEQGHAFVATGLQAFAFELPLYIILKNVFKRGRPSDVIISAHIVPSDKFSLPSGHTAAAFVMATVISFYWPFLTPFIFAWACLIGLSRVLLGVHYPSDVFCGAALGMSCAWLSIQLI
ncbi:phosphatase PAP2 family protein [Saccharobesus litoralis]|uniref:undecaprenyl-diphosphate phosphatase n=1 Tax=Saccharobesus litoralis TaxID=2172099 RepID=A0A2S0VQS0_9ALTE|nr:phosphatase PAP2 family protein [Saccharobesus litoralis]AWB66561.1 phosphatase PAP2 family protein [Saccharobesus litoralis]